jgi:hypothetical protein
VRWAISSVSSLTTIHSLVVIMLGHFRATVDEAIDAFASTSTICSLVGFPF